MAFDKAMKNESVVVHEWKELPVGLQHPPEKETSTILQHPKAQRDKP
jgi:hypothetical protein